MNKTTISILSAITLLSTAGCTPDVTAPSPGSDGTPHAPVHPAAKPTTSVTSPGTVSITGYTHSADGASLPGVDVCVGSEAEDPAMPVRTCVTSDAAGKWTIPAAPRFTRIRLTFEKADFAPVLRVVESEYADIELPADENRLVAKSASNSFMGVPTDVTKGAIEFAVNDGAVATAVTLRGLDGTTATARYLDANGTVSPDAQAGARGGFANLAPGLYAVTFGGGATSCFATSTLYGYPETVYLDPASGKATVLVPVVDGYVTAPVGVSCAASGN